DYLEVHTPLRLQAPGFFADYYADRPGGKPRGRSLESTPFDAKQLGEWAARLRRSPVYPPVTMAEGSIGDVTQLNFALIAERYEQDIRTMGSALVASLFKGLLDRGVETLNSTRARALVRNGDGAVIGVRAERDGAAFYAGARKAVVIA